MARQNSLSRAAHERAGRRAEWLAELLLRVKGYRILGRRYRSRQGEIDLIATRGRFIAFVEVKARAKRDDALTAITPTAESRICNAAVIWLSRHRPDHQGDVRYDLITVTKNWPRHHEDAFRPRSDLHNGANFF